MHIDIGGRLVGDGQPCFIIAEIGSNHDQDLGLAHKMIDAAVDAGVDAVKFQTFAADTHYSKFAESPGYLEEKNIHGLIRSLELNRSWQAELKDHAEERNVVFMSSPCDPAAVRELAELNMEAYKVASFDMPDLDLVRLIAEQGKPVILSTGLADWMEIQRAVDACKSVGNDQIALLQCTSLYPAPASLSNLAAMDSMKAAYEIGRASCRERV